jgi:hypothetical protein
MVIIAPSANVIITFAKLLFIFSFRLIKCSLALIQTVAFTGPSISQIYLRLNTIKSNRTGFPEKPLPLLD